MHCETSRRRRRRRSLSKDLQVLRKHTHSHIYFLYNSSIISSLKNNKFSSPGRFGGAEKKKRSSRRRKVKFRPIAFRIIHQVHDLKVMDHGNHSLNFARKWETHHDDDYDFGLKPRRVPSWTPSSQASSPPGSQKDRQTRVEWRIIFLLLKSHLILLQATTYWFTNVKSNLRWVPVLKITFMNQRHLNTKKC